MFNSQQPVTDVVLAVTYSCNSRCQFCHIWKNKKTHSLRPVDYLRLPHNIKYVNISGGEPFLRKDLPDIIQAIVQRCPAAQIVISTNGLCPQQVLKQTPKILKIKKDLGVAVSIDGLKPIHENLRGVKGGFDLAFETLQILRNLRVPNIKIAFTLSDQNWHQLPKVYQLARYCQAQFSLALLHNSEHFFQTQDNILADKQNLSRALNWLTRQELKGFWPSKRWLRAYFTYGANYFLRYQHRLLPDYSGFNSLFIDPDGNIFPSTAWNLNLGNLTQIKHWSNFLAQAQARMLPAAQAPTSWMVCTARQAIKKHPLKVVFWILKKKLLAV